MSERVERRLVGLLGQPRHDPYGNPIPGLEELGLEPTSPEQVRSVVDVATAEPGSPFSRHPRSDQHRLRFVRHRREMFLNEEIQPIGHSVDGIKLENGKSW